MFENYDFTKTKDCLRTGIVGCLTRFPNSRIKIFYPIELGDQSHLEKPNDWWWLHLPLVISINSTYVPVTHPRYNIPHTQKRESVASSRWVVKQLRGVDELATPLGTLREFSL